MFREHRSRRAARRRAGRSTFVRLRREAWRDVRSVWPRVVVFLGCWGALSVGISWMQRTDFLRGFFAGLMLGLLGLFVMVFLVATGIAQRQMGGSAEQWTADLFEKLDRGRWYVAHDVSFETLNVDHVLVGPRRIYVVETKWTTWAGNGKFIQGARACAERGARKLSGLLASQGLQREVIPLVVVWGPGSKDMPADPEWTDGIGIVAGPHAKVWLEGLRSSGRDLARDLPVERAITGFITARDTYADAG